MNCIVDYVEITLYKNLKFSATHIDDNLNAVKVELFTGGELLFYGCCAVEDLGMDGFSRRFLRIEYK